MGYHKKKDLYKMYYAGSSTMAVKAIQGQQLIVEDQQKQIEGLKKRLEKIEVALLKK